MSISNIATKYTYAGNASISTAYPVTFKYLSSDHVTVYADSVDITETCTFAGDGTTGAGEFTTAAYAPTTTITVVLDVPLDQPVVLQELGSLPAKTIEVEGFDRLNMQVRRVWRKLQDVLTFNTDEANGSTGTADNLIGFDGSGDIAEIPNTTFLQQDNNLSELANAPDQAAAQTNLNVDPAGTDNSTDVTKTGAGTYISLAGQVLTVDEITETDLNASTNASLDLADTAIQTTTVFDVRSYGTVGDGTTDDGVAIQAAITAAEVGIDGNNSSNTNDSATMTVVDLAGGEYGISETNNLTITRRIRFQNGSLNAIGAGWGSGKMIDLSSQSDGVILDGIEFNGGITADDLDGEVIYAIQSQGTGNTINNCKVRNFRDAGIRLVTGGRQKVTNCDVYKWRDLDAGFSPATSRTGNGIQIEANSESNVITNCSFFYCGKSVQLNPNGSEKNVFNNCRFISNGEDIPVGGEGQVEIPSKNYFNHCYFGGVRATLIGTGSAPNTEYEVYFNSCIFSKNYDAEAIYVDTTATDETVSGLVVANCAFSSTYTSPITFNGTGTYVDDIAKNIYWNSNIDETGAAVWSGAKFGAGNDITGGVITLVDGNEGAGKVLTSDANGSSSWAAPTNGTVQGTGANTRNIRAADEGTVVGDARGEGSVDLQTSTALSTQVASGANSSIIGGQNNTASGTKASVCGGALNINDSVNGFIGGGSTNNVNTSSGTAIIGGLRNTASGTNAVVLGGADNQATATDSLAAGDNARAIHIGARVFADSSDTDFPSIIANEFAIQANALRLVDGNEGAGNVLTSDANGSGNWAAPAKVVYTVATLPATPAQGDVAIVTDALAPAFLSAVADTGAVVTPVFYNGTAWIVG